MTDDVFPPQDGIKGNETDEIIFPLNFLLFIPVLVDFIFFL